MMFNAHAKEYVDTDGPVRHLDGSGLKRPIDMPKSAMVVMGAFVVVAAIIGGTVLFNVLDDVHNSAARTQLTVEENLSRPVTLDLPQLSSLFLLDNESIKQTFANAGFTTYELTSTEDEAKGGFDLFKLPSDVSVADAGVMYLSGINSLSAADASRFLNGSWRMTVTRNDGTDMGVWYADFASGSVDAAIQSALAAEALDTSTMGESGTDESGNTFQTGTVDVGGTICSWRISAILLSSYYDIEGLPDTAVYVGIRMSSL